MVDQVNPSALVSQQSYEIQLNNVEVTLLNFLKEQGLPTQSVLVSVNERVIVFKNIADVITKLTDEQKPRSVYSGSQKDEVCSMPYALCPMPYALCPMPYVGHTSPL